MFVLPLCLRNVKPRYFKNGKVLCPMRIRYRYVSDIFRYVDDRNFYGIFSINFSSKMTKTDPNTKENLQK
jgi:hypothetical protein